MCYLAYDIGLQPQGQLAILKVDHQHAPIYSIKGLLDVPHMQASFGEKKCHRVDV